MKIALKKTTFKQRAYETIQDRILHGQYLPGELLNRRGVAAGLGMSVLPVHEAMLQLESDGLLEALSRVGTRVRTVSGADVRDHLVVREALECQAARLICGSTVEDNLERLLPMAAALDALDPLNPRSAEAEVRFHGALVDLAGCPALSREYQRIMRIGWFYRINRTLSPIPSVPADLHQAFLRALAHAAPLDAEECIRTHIRYGKPERLTPAPLPRKRRRPCPNTTP